CVRGDTLVVTEHGPMPIREICGAVRVLSWDAKGQRFRLSPSGGAFPKGRARLYRVCTPAGEFVASAHHRVLCADGTYRRVEHLRAGLAIASCAPSRQQTIWESARLSSPAGGLHCSQTAVGSLVSYADAARRYGQ